MADPHAVKRLSHGPGTAKATIAGGDMRIRKSLVFAVAAAVIAGVGYFM